MKLSFKTKRARKIVKKELISNFEKNSFRKGGYLWSAFKEFYFEKDSKVCYCLDKKEFVGWGLLWKDYNKSYSLMLFVRKQYRRLGIGTKIIKILSKKIKKKIDVYPHNKTSKKFFRKAKKEVGDKLCL